MEWGDIELTNQILAWKFPWVWAKLLEKLQPKLWTKLQSKVRAKLQEWISIMWFHYCSHYGKRHG